MSGNITIFLGHYPRIREDKRRETILLKFGPFLALFVQNWTKFGHRMVLALHFLFGPF